MVGPPPLPGEEKLSLSSWCRRKRSWVIMLYRSDVTLTDYFVRLPVTKVTLLAAYMCMTQRRRKDFSTFVCSKKVVELFCHNYVYTYA